MTRNPWDSYKALMEIRSRMADLFQQSMTQVDFIGDTASGGASWHPPFDVVESSEEIVILGELPGLSKEDLKVQIKGLDLVISGERRPECSGGGQMNFHLSERHYGNFVRSFHLPEAIDDGQIKTHFKDGILEVRLMKSRPREIPIQ